MKMNINIKRLQLSVMGPMALASALGMQMSTADAAETGDDTQVAEPGYTTENFHIQPEIQLTTYYDDNIYATSQAEVSDTIAVITPLLKVHSHWDRHSLKFEAGASIGRYLDNPSEDYEDLWLEASGNYEISPTSSLFGAAGYYKKHEGRDVKESDQSADEPTTYDVQSIQLGGRTQVGENVVRLVVSQEKLDFDNVGTLFNDDRDRTHSALGLRVTRALDKRTRVYLQGVLNQRDYDLISGGVNRDSDGYGAVVGLVKSFGKEDRIEAYAGVLSQEYDDPAFDKVTAADFGLKLQWHPAERYTVTGSLSRTLSETTEEGASGYLLTKLDLQLEKTFSSRTTGFIGYTYGHYDYQGIGRKDDYNGFSLGLNYRLNRRVQISASYSYHDNDSNDAILNPLPGDSYDFSKNQFLLTLRAGF
jgi:hypothetical protein